MPYRYEDLGDDGFQRLVSALLASEGGRDVRAMPLGQSDGGRDAVHGDYAYQVKFSGDGARLKHADTWLLAALRGEEPSVRNLVARGTRTYVLVTNVGGTGALDRGTIDKADAAAKALAAAWGLDGITIWWRDDVDARFAQSSISTKLAFQGALSPSELLAITLVDVSAGAGHIDRVLAAYIADRYDADNKVRFEAADLIGPTVDGLFVDVPARSYSAGSAADGLIRRIGTPDRDDIPPDGGGSSAGAARVLLNPNWSGNALIFGGPGQGKSTLLQYLCQFHRARHLRRAEYQQEHPPTGPVSSLTRIPIRIDLRDYAQWAGAALAPAAESAPAAGGKALELFIAEHIDAHSGGLGFNGRDLVRVLAERPVLIALDGLDEVASLAARDLVAEQISKTAARLTANAADLVILVTTRPGATSFPALLSDRFPALALQPLTEALRLRYLHRWASQVGLSEEQTMSLARKFATQQTLPHVRELASNPMQLAILLHLLQRRGILPEQRTKLYYDYVQVFLDREAPKEPIVASHRDLVEAVHGYLAWHLQTQAELGATRGTLTIDEMRPLLERFLRDRGQAAELFQQLMEAVTSRVICLVQRESGRFEFEVQPLREYFAARHIFDNAPPNGAGSTRDDCLDAMLRRPYWSNVMRYFVGMLSKGEVRGLAGNLRTIQAKAEFDRLPLARSVAVQLLEDQVFLNQTDGTLREIVDLAVRGPGAIMAADRLLTSTGRPLELGEGAGRSQLVDLARERLRAETDPAIRSALANLLLTHDDPAALRRWWWSDDVREVSAEWLASAADMRCLGDISGDEAVHLADCATAAGAAGSTVVEALLGAGSNCGDDAVIAQCIRELGDGAHDPAAAGSGAGDTPAAHVYRALLEAAYPRALGREGPFLLQRPQRPRRDRSVPLWRRTVEALAAAASPDSARRVLALHSATGDSWLLRESILTQDGPMLLKPPASWGLPVGPAAGFAAFAAGAVANRGDIQWWLSNRGEAGSLDQRSWLLAVLVHARAAVIVELMPEVDRQLGDLSPLSAQALLLACDRHGVDLAHRSVDLHAPLRAGLHVSPLLALALHPLAFDPTKAELRRRIAAGIPELLSRGRVTASLARGVAGEVARALPAASLRGFRASIADGPLPLNVRYPAGTLARQILADPQEWPSRLVRSAADVLGARLAKLPPIAQVAESDRWFEW